MPAQAEPQPWHVKLNHTQFLGYGRDENGQLVVIEEESEIVRLIFDLYLQGYACRKIKRYLEEKQIPTVTSKSEWSTSTIDRILSNEKYFSCALTQKTCVEDFLTHKQEKNTGNVPQFMLQNSHPAIILIEIFQAVQERKEFGCPSLDYEIAMSQL
ncbi:MAG: recombinase family protein [Lachnospiraceae bacterium]